MKKVFLILLFVSFSLNQALATSLRDALSLAYKKNSELNAERENINVAKQELKISKSDYFPTATITTSKSKEDTNKLTNQSGSDATISDVDPLNTSVKLEQTLIDFGRGADYTKNKIGIELSEAQLLKKEQLIFYKVIEVFSEVISSEEKLKINQSNNNDILKIIGPPSTKSTFENDVYIYIERNKQRNKMARKLKVNPCGKNE